MQLSDDRLTTMIDRSRAAVSRSGNVVERVGGWQIGKSKTAGHYLRTNWICDGREVFNFMFVPKGWIGKA